MPPIRWAAAGRSSPSAEVTSERRAWLQLYLQKSPCTATPSSAFHCTQDGIAKHITWCVQRPDTKVGGRFCKAEDRKPCKSKFCLKAGYEMTHNFTFPEDPKQEPLPQALMVHSKLIQLSCWPFFINQNPGNRTETIPAVTDLLSQQELRGLRGLVVPPLLSHSLCIARIWRHSTGKCLCNLSPLCPCRLSKGAVTI